MVEKHVSIVYTHGTYRVFIDDNSLNDDLYCMTVKYFSEKEYGEEAWLEAMKYFRTLQKKI